MTGPAPYSNRDEEETLAIDTFKILVDHKQVKVDIKERDKYPNIDGYIEIVDEKRQVIGKLEAQVKKLPNDCGISPKLPCPISLFEYAKNATSPVLLIGVDVNQKKAFWIPISEDLIREKEKRKEQQTLTVSFHLDRAVNDKDTRYVTEWIGLAQDYQRRLREYDRLKEAYAKLSNATLQVLTIAKSDLREIHKFLDEINSLLDGPFSIIKKRFYANAWKVGLAYDGYTATSVGYTLYPILSDENDVQIKQVDQIIKKEFVSLHGFSQYFKENPIKFRPRLHAIELIMKRLKLILTHRLLQHRGSETLAREYLFAFLDRFADQMGLDERQSYSVTEIENGYYRHFPFWIDEAVKFLVRLQRNRITKPSDCFYGRPYLDPDMLRGQIMSNEIGELRQLVANRVKSKEPVPIMRVGSEHFPFGLFVEFLSFLASSGVKEVQRLYAPEDSSQAPQGGFPWQFYSPEDLEKNLKSLFDNLPAVYSIIVEQNFPQLKDHLAPFHAATRVIAVLDDKNEYGGVDFYYLKCKDESDIHIDLCRKGQRNELVEKLHRLGESVELDGRRYEIIGDSSIVLFHIWVDLPILSFVYQELANALRRYFTRFENCEQFIWHHGF
jgi:hypothetical protein